MKATHQLCSGNSFLGQAGFFAITFFLFVFAATRTRSLAVPPNDHWAFKPLSVVEPIGEGLYGSGNPIDKFVLRRLRAEELNPVGLAGKETLLRRTYFDLTGLPPTPADLREFLADSSDDAWMTVVERLLASPQYGERWGRHWMDVVRYADTAGDNADYPVPEAFRYRNYIIDAFNRDKPYDEFVREQLAGDILAKRGPRERYTEQLVATGFLASSRRYATGPYELWHLTLENTIDTVGQAFLGLNLRCARCHDHKYDPVSTQDYYGLYGIFESTDFPWPGGEELQSKSIGRQKFVPLAPESEVISKISAWRQKTDAVKRGITSLESSKPPSGSEEAKKLASLKTELRNLERRGVPADLPAAYAVQEGKARNSSIQLKGDPEKVGPIAPRRAPRCLAGDSALQIPQDASGRVEFAEWLTRKENGLFARVMVNRIWQHHFGRGLVATPNNFGSRGEAPSDPELLDYLAGRFIDSGWSIKSVHRLILGSFAYRLSSADDLANQRKDPSNRYHWRFERRRLEAEAIRDAMLFVGGALDLRQPGEHPFPPVERWNWTQHNPFKEIYSTQHRSVYLMTPRFQRHPFLALFDGPDTNSSTGERRASIVPQQALYMLNHPFVDEQAHLLAQRILAIGDVERTRLRFAHELVWNRSPSEQELARAESFLRSAESALRDGAGDRQEQAWASLARVFLCANEFLYVD